MAPVQPQPMLFPANFQVAVADIAVAICKDESLRYNLKLIKQDSEKGHCTQGLSHPSVIETF